MITVNLVFHSNGLFCSIVGFNEMVVQHIDQFAQGSVQQGKPLILSDGDILYIVWRQHLLNLEGGRNFEAVQKRIWWLERPKKLMVDGEGDSPFPRVSCAKN